MLEHLRKDFKSFYLPLILSIAISYIFYVISIKDRIPVFSTETLRTRIIDSKNIATAPIQVIGPNSMLIKNDLSAVIFHFWNRGGEAIESSDVLKPIYITLSDTSTRFIDVKVNKISRIDITKTKVAIFQNRRAITINFNILDEDDGITCQVIFEGNPKSDLIINGAIKGVKSFDRTGVSILQYSSLVLILCALATIVIMIAIKTFNWYALITYKDYYVENFHHFLTTAQTDKLKAYTESGKRDNEIFNRLIDLYSTDRDKFREDFDLYTSDNYQKGKEYFANNPIFPNPFWYVLKQLVFLVIYTIIAISVWNLLKTKPEVLNPINKSSYYSMVKSILFTSQPREPRE